MTPTQLLTAAQASLTLANQNIADANTLIEQAKAQIGPPTTTYPLSVVSGSGDGNYLAGAVVPIVADAPPVGSLFDRWTGDVAAVAAPAQPSTSVTMPAAPVSVAALYQDVTPPTPGRVTRLVHLGSFRVPVVGSTDAQGYPYGGTSLGFNPAHHSLFMGGLVTACRVGEIGIPAFGATGANLQSPADPFGGKLNQINPGDPNQKYVGGTLVNGSQLIVTAYSSYDGTGSQVLSHFVRPVSLGAGPVVGPLRAGPLGAGFYSGYMGWVDPAWVTRFKGPALTGNACLNVISRTSYGPSVTSFDPANIGNAVELVGYPDAHQTLGPWNKANQYFGGSDQMKGVVMPVNTGSVLFFGRHGTTFCYGEGSACGDPTDSSKGVHGYPYNPSCWCYDAGDLAAVAAGQKQPWDVVPYLIFTVPNMKANAQIGGAAYDPATGHIYLSEQFGDGDKPLIHVYEAH